MIKTVAKILRYVAPAPKPETEVCAKLHISRKKLASVFHDAPYGKYLGRPSSDTGSTWFVVGTDAGFSWLDNYRVCKDANRGTSIRANIATIVSIVSILIAAALYLQFFQSGFLGILVSTCKS